MIVGSLFEGDGDVDMLRLQHNAYADALGVIVRGCQEHFRSAMRLLEHGNPEIVDTLEREAPEILAFFHRETFDHRALQDAHDLIAAAWRHRRSHVAQSSLFPKIATGQQKRDDWIDWLKSEVADWRFAPELPWFILTILRHQHDPIGDHTQAKLVEVLRQRYEDVPWATGATT